MLRSFLGLFWLIRTIKNTFFFLYLWQLKEYHLGRFISHFDTEKGKFKTWLFVIAKNTALDFLKKKKDILFSSLDAERCGMNAEGNAESFADRIADVSFSPFEILANAELG